MKFKYKYIIPSVFFIWAVLAYNCGKVEIDVQDGNLHETTDQKATGIPDVPNSVSVASTTLSSVSLSWTVLVEKIPTEFYEIKVDESSTTIPIEAPASSTTVTGLVPSTAYQFQVRACNVVSCSEYSPIVTATTLAAPDTQAPTIPTDLASNGRSMNSISLIWNASTDAAGVKEYHVRRSNNNSLIVIVNSNMLTTNITGLTAGTAYLFDIEACDASNNCSGYSSDLSVSTLAAPDTTAPSVPTGLNATNISQTAATLTWSASTDNSGVAPSYELSIDNGNVIAVTGTSYPATGFTAGSNHSFKVLAKDGSGNKSVYASFSFSTSAAADTQAPSVPTGLTASNIQPTTATLSWNASTDNSGVAPTYEISVDNGAAATVSTTSYLAAGLSAGASHNFKVLAKDGSGNKSAYSSAFTFMTAPMPSSTSVPRTLASRVSVPVFATVQPNPASINVQWSNVGSGGAVVGGSVIRDSITIYKRTKGSAVTWVNIATPSASSNSYMDTNVVAGTTYEYKIQMSVHTVEKDAQGNLYNSNATAYGYMTAGVGIVAPVYNGKIVVVADSALYSATSSQMITLLDDLYSDGWIPSFISVSRTATAPQVKSQIKAIYDADAANVKAVLLVGHVPVPYSGTNIAPDGHSEHVGAWPADGYYGEMNSTWTQGGGTVWAGFANERNSYPAAASKFTANSFPSAVELAVGRIDFYNMPTFSLTELQLTNNYLTKARNFKRGLAPATKRMHIGDNLEWADAPFSRSAWSLTSAVGPTNITASYYGNANYVLGNNQSYLWGYIGGGGSITSADGQGNTGNFAATNFNMVFNMSFGSYFGDFDMKDNYLKAIIATPGKSLVNIYSGAHQFYGQDMAVGGTVGYSMIQSQNNTDANYNAANGGCCGSGNVFLTIMGDPTLRQFYPQAPSNLNASGNNLTWTAAGGTIDGYNVYQITATAITKINTTLIAGTSYTVSTGVAGKQLMVRAVKKESTNAGSYEALSLGTRKDF